MPVLIPLTGGHFATIDDADVALVEGLKWQCWEYGDHRYARTHIKVSGGRRGVAMHRLILGVSDIKQTVDHIDGNGLNNCRNNLRIVSRGQNKSNSIKRAEAACIFKGVAKKGMKWGAQISAREANLSSVPWYIGTFDTAVDAARAYDAVARILFGRHARLNFPREGEVCAIPLERPEAA